MNDFWAFAEAALDALDANEDELGLADERLSCLDDFIVQNLARGGLFAASGHSERAVSERVLTLTRAIREKRQTNPLVVADPTTMAAETEYTARTAFDTQAVVDLDEWVWSPIGPPQFGNAARLEGSYRHEAHLQQMWAVFPELADPAEIRQQIERDITSITAETSVRLEENRETSKHLYATRNTLRAGQHQDVADAHAALAAVTEQIVVGLFDAWVLGVLLDCIAAPSPLDAYAWVSLDTCTQIRAWQKWIAEHVCLAADAVSGPPDAEMVRWVWWSAAELLVTAEYLMAVHGRRVDEAAQQMAMLLIGRHTDDPAAAVGRT